MKSSDLRDSIVNPLMLVIGLMTCCTKFLSFRFLLVKPPNITSVSYSVEADVANSPRLEYSTFFWIKFIIMVYRFILWW